MAGKKSELVPRPRKKNEFEIRFATTHAAKGWRDLVASIRNHMAETWDFLVLLQSWAGNREDSVFHLLMGTVCQRVQAVSKTRLMITASGFDCP